jgi:hypothetical protein
MEGTDEVTDEQWKLELAADAVLAEEVERRTIERVATWIRSQTRHSDWDWESDAAGNEVLYRLAERLLAGAWKEPTP